MFEVNIRQLCDVMEHHNTDGVERLKLLGGTNELIKKLRSDMVNGISQDEQELEKREEIFGLNEIPPNPPKSFFLLVKEASEDILIMMLLVCAVVSIGLSFYQDIDERRLKEIHDTFVFNHQLYNIQHENNIDWLEGVAILVSVILVVFVTAFNDWRKERQFRGLKKKLELQEHVTVIRDGHVIEIEMKKLMVGDIYMCKYGDIVPADGIIIQSNDIKTDESSLTGESKLLKKSAELAPFLLSGTQIMEGTGRMLVTAVGVNSQAGIIKSLLSNKQHLSRRKTGDIKTHSTMDEITGVKFSITDSNIGGIGDTDTIYSNINQTGDDLNDKQKSVLQEKLGKLSFQIGTMAIILASLTMFVLFLRFLIEDLQQFTAKDVKEIIRIIITGVTVLVVAIPEGLPLAVTISLAYAVNKMLDDHNFVRHLDACETMGNATTICSDKTGTLTMNRMTVVQFYMGLRIYTDVHLKQNLSINQNLITSFCESISVNSNYSSKIISTYNENELDQQIGNKTECGLLGMVRQLKRDYEIYRYKYPETSFLHVYTFNSNRKYMATVIIDEDKHRKLLIKGASEIILERCINILDEYGSEIQLTQTLKTHILTIIIQQMASEGLRTIALAYRYLPTTRSINWDDEESILSNLTLIAICALQDPVRPEVPEAIRLCQRAGITVRMVTGDNIATARAIAQKCGIIYPGDLSLVIEGTDFNRCIRRRDGEVDQTLFNNLWPRLRVLARSSPTDKYTLVKHIIESQVNIEREIVAVTGDGTNDGPALRKADVGFAMGIQGTDVAKEASDVIITDDNFNSIVKAVLWGRNVYDSIAKFIQFQLTVNIVAVTFSFVTACLLRESPLRAVQMLWVNLIMDTLASLALAAELPDKSLLQRKPYGRKRPIISRIMMKNMISHAFYQLSVIYLLLFFGDDLFDLDSGIPDRSRHVYFRPNQHFTMIFNTFVMMTLFNQINSRKVHGERNVFLGLWQNKTFLGIWITVFIIQVIIVQVLDDIFSCRRLDGDIWMVCLMFGVGSLMWEQIICFINIVDKSHIKNDTLEELSDITTIWSNLLQRVNVQYTIAKAYAHSINVNV